MLKPLPLGGRAVCRPTLLTALVAVMLNACATYNARIPDQAADNVALAQRLTVRVTTIDGTTHELTKAHFARDTLFGTPAFVGGAEVGFALLDIQRFTLIQPASPRPYVATRLGDVLPFAPLLLMYAILSAFRHA